MTRIMIALLCAISTHAQALTLRANASPVLEPQAAHDMYAAKPRPLMGGGNAAEHLLRIGNLNYAVDLPYSDDALVESGLASIRITPEGCCASVLADFERRGNPTVNILGYGDSFSSMKPVEDDLSAALPVLAMGIVGLGISMQSRRTTARLANA